ncbi:transglutaminase family protein [Albimonas sp. CAU 1670]|uniref:transglutaminase family protein n=1 Tax=Albimonas sp. CAU 1670 TaxID=3032599 RepID=UPI0023DBEF18|nr:transglutaminase family protein [Albimonas sp. CAU 1670]MDF2235582.1 transglutaminase family protein [Albimonas sp. CAU 1670]
MSRLRVRHETRYVYGAPAAFSQHLLRLTPVERPDQKVLSHSLTVTPEPQDLDRFDDGFGNHLATATVSEPHDTLEIVAETVVERLPAPEIMPGASTPWEAAAAAAAAPAGLAAALFAFPTRYTEADDAIEAYARRIFTPGRPVLEAARELCAAVHADFAYVPGATGADTIAAHSFAAREGVCQDFAHVMLAAMRALRVPCAYVSGYLRTLPPPGQERLIGADATHAWVSVWDPGHGWVQFDPTNDVEPGEDHVLAATGRDYADCAPVTGLVVGSGGQMLSVSVDVADPDEIAPRPRPAAPAPGPGPDPAPVADPAPEPPEA